MSVRQSRQRVINTMKNHHHRPKESYTRLISAFLRGLAFFIFFVMHGLLAILQNMLLTIQTMSAGLARRAFRARNAHFINSSQRRAVFSQLILRRRIRNTGRDSDNKSLFILLFRRHTRVFRNQRFRLLNGIQLAKQRMTIRHLATFVRMLVLIEAFQRNSMQRFFGIDVKCQRIRAVTSMTGTIRIRFLRLINSVFPFHKIARTVTFGNVNRSGNHFTFNFLHFLRYDMGFLQVIATTIRHPSLLIDPINRRHYNFQVFARRIFTSMNTVFQFRDLMITIGNFIRRLSRLATNIFARRFVPATTPRRFGRIPTNTFGSTFRFIGSLTIANSQTIGTLRIAISSRSRIIRFLANNSDSHTLKFQLIRFAITRRNMGNLFENIFRTTIFRVFRRFDLMGHPSEARARESNQRLPRFQRRFQIQMKERTVTVRFLARIVRLLFNRATFRRNTHVGTQKSITLRMRRITTVLFITNTRRIIRTGIVSNY